MALSNWDTLAFNSEGQPCRGDLTLPSGASIAIYKNWPYVRHPNMWIEGGQFTKPTIAEIQSGNINLAGFDIQAIRRHRLYI